ncbi:MAG: hypothetical protein ABGW78_10355, partial [Pirellulales bacterium]
MSTRVTKKVLMAFALGVVLQSVVLAAEEPSSIAISFVESSRSSDSIPPVTAVGLRWNADEQPAAPKACDILILFDTSASQAGLFRSDAERILSGILNNSRPQDRFHVVAADVSCSPLGNNFVTANETMLQSTLLAIEERTPLGTTDLPGIIAEASGLFDDSPRPRSIIYVGDGPGVTGIEAHILYEVTELLRTRRITFSAVGVGPRVNWQALAALANATGGMLLVPDSSDAMKQAGHDIGHLAIQSVWWPENTVFSNVKEPISLLTLPTRMPPLRADRDSIVLVEDALEGATIDLTLVPSETLPADEHNGLSPIQPTRVAVPRSVPLPENTYLEELVRNAASTGGVFLPLLGKEGLDIAKSVIRGEASSLADLSKQAESAGAHGSAFRLATAALRRDPDNVDASLVRSVAVARLQDPFADDAAPSSDNNPAFQEGPGAGLDGNDDFADLEAMRKVRSQALQ